MEHATEIAIIGTNVLVFLATVALALVTGADVVKDQNKTIREAIKGLVTVNNRKPQPNPIPGQEELRLVADDGRGA
jgi:hypothetical protein